jgi:DNA-directed RNA polymerase specialized sigma24 family protein/ribosome-associated translation inhibitor RaiA
VARIDDIVGHFPRARTTVAVEHSPRKGGVGVSLTVRLSTRTLFATAWGSDLRSSVESAADKVVRQAKRHLDVLRREQRAGAESVRQRRVAPAPIVDLEAARDLEDFGDRVAEHAARLNEVLQRERQLDPRAREAGGRISVSDLVEEALAYVFEHFREKPKSMTPDRWLVRRGLLFFREAVDRAYEGPGHADPLPQPDEREDWEELLELDFPVLESDPLDDRPAEAARASPDQLERRRAAQRATAEALQELPDRHRLAVTLHHLEGYELPEIAYVLNATEAQAEDWLLRGETALQDRLGDWRGI